MAGGKGQHFGRSEFREQDFVEIAIRGCIMGFPAAVTKEVRNLGTELTLIHAMIFSLASLFFLAILIFVLHG